MKLSMSCILAATLLILTALPFAVTRGDTAGEVDNIVYMAETEESGALAEKIANLIIAHGLGSSFHSVFIISNRDDEDLSPIMILKLSEKGDAIPLRGNEKLDKLIKPSDCKIIGSIQIN